MLLRVKKVAFDTRQLVSIEERNYGIKLLLSNGGMIDVNAEEYGTDSKTLQNAFMLCLNSISFKAKVLSLVETMSEDVTINFLHIYNGHKTKLSKSTLITEKMNFTNNSNI